MNIERSAGLLQNVNGVRLRVLDGGHAEGAREWAAQVADPPYARLYYICGGDAYIVSENGHSMPLEPGMCCLLPMGFSFRYACRTRMEQLYFHIRLDDDAGGNLLSGGRMLTGMADSGRIRRLIELAKSDDLLAGLYLRQELMADILGLLELGGVAPGRARYARCVREAVSYIHGNLSMQLTVAGLAAHAHVSESTLEKSFRAQTGMTIGRYIDEAVFSRAEELLRHTELSAAQISEMLGFCDQFYFSRRFSRRYGMPPQRYRKSCRI